MARKNGYTAAQFIKAIPGTGGVISAIADRVGCDWNTAKKYIEKYPTVKEAYENEKSRVDDKAKSVVIKDIVERESVETSKWWLRVKMPEEFAPKEISEHQGDVTITVKYGDDGSDG